MKRLINLFLPVVLGALMAPLLANAAAFSVENNLPKGTIVKDNLYMIAESPVIMGVVDGDLVVFGGNVIITGTIRGDALVFGANVILTGDIVGDFRVFAANLTVSGRVGGEVMMTGGLVNVEQGAQITKDLVLGVGSFSVNPKANILGKKIPIMQDDRFVLKNGFIGMFIKIDPFWNPVVDLGLWILGLLVIATVVYVFFDKYFNLVVQRAISGNDVWRNLGVGMLILLVMPISSFICFVSLIGIPFGIVLLSIYILLLTLSLSMGGVLFGETIRRLIFGHASRDVSLGWGFGGIVVLSLLSVIPYLGWLIGFAAFLIALGVFGGLKWHILRSPHM